VVAVSSPIAERLVKEGVPRHNVHLIPNGWAGGVDFLPRGRARRVLGLPDGRPVVGYVARLIPAKGPDVFVEAMLRLDDHSVCAAIIGDGSQRAQIEGAIRAAGGTDRFFMIGHLDDAAPLFKAFDLFVLSSRTEGTPITLFEAMAAGVPTVVTSVGGVPDVVTPMQSLLVPPEDPDALARAIREALRTPAATAERTCRASARLQSEFGAERWLHRHEMLYRDLAGL
jgi:glycosyltransferase involved in cell wall biosynthesis